MRPVNERIFFFSSIRLLLWVGLIGNPHVGFAQTGFGRTSNAVTIAIPLERRADEQPAMDLAENDRPLTLREIQAKANSRADLSLLNPAASDFFSGAGAWPKTEALPIGVTVPKVRLVGTIEDSPRGWFRTQVLVDAKNENGTLKTGGPASPHHLRMVLSPQVHSYLLRDSILRKMGYKFAPVSWRARTEVVFDSLAAKEDFFLKLENAVLNLTRSRFIVEDKGLSVVIRDVLFESPVTTYSPTAFAMGRITATRVGTSRLTRALLVPFVIADLSEILEYYRTDCARIQNQNWVTDHASADQFADTATIDDVRWAARKIVGLTRADWSEVARHAKLPPDLTALVTEQIVTCRNKMVETLLSHEAQSFGANGLPVKLEANLNVSVGAVQNGRLPIGYSHPDLAISPSGLSDPEAPIQADAVKRFFRIELTSGLIGQVLSRLNSGILELRGSDELIATRNEKLRAQFIDHIQSKPNEPFAPKAASFNGTLAGFSVNAGRSILTGSYFGSHSSDFKMNLVDQLAVTGRIGYVAGIDGLPKISPGLNANLSRTRSYVHVKPIATVKAGEYESWKDLLVPNYMASVGEMFEVSEDLSSKDPGKLQSAQKRLEDSVAKFLKSFEENESLIVTEADSVGMSANLNSSLSRLFNLTPMRFANSISIGGQWTESVNQRILITRDPQFLQVLLQGYGGRTRSLNFGLSYWLDLMQVTKSSKGLSGKTRAFQIPLRVGDRDAVKLASALRGLLVSGETELLEAAFEPSTLNHKLTAESQNLKFLFLRWTKLEELHRVLFTPKKVQPCSDERSTVDPNCVYDAKTKTASIRIDPQLHTRELSVHRLLDRAGKNFMGFASDTLDALVQNSTSIRPGLLANANTPNPRDSFYGSAKWRVVSTEGEVTSSRELNPRTTVTTTWGGWDLSRDSLFAIFDLIDARTANLFRGQLSTSLIDRSSFARTEKLQLYEIKTYLMVFEPALKKLQTEIERNFASLNQKPKNPIRRALGWDKYSGSDPEFIQGVLQPLMDPVQFAVACVDLKQSRIEQNLPEMASLYGQDHDCLLPWMEEALRLRRSPYPADRAEQLKWLGRWVALLETSTDFSRLIEWLGVANVYFQVGVNGFRVGDKQGDKTGFVSSTLGVIRSEQRESVFEELSRVMNLTSSEVYASHLSEAN